MIERDERDISIYKKEMDIHVYGGEKTRNPIKFILSLGVRLDDNWSSTNPLIRLDIIPY